MNLYLIAQTKNDDHDTYDSAVVAAKSESDARTIHPSSLATHVSEDKWMGTRVQGGEYVFGGYSWVEFADRHEITVEHLGKTKRERGVVLGSFNAG